VQVIAWKDSSPKWPIMCRARRKTSHSLTRCFATAVIHGGTVGDLKPQKYWWASHSTGTSSPLKLVDYIFDYLYCKTQLAAFEKDGLSCFFYPWRTLKTSASFLREMLMKVHACRFYRNLHGIQMRSVQCKSSVWGKTCARKHVRRACFLYKFLARVSRLLDYVNITCSFFVLTWYWTVKIIYL